MSQLDLHFIINPQAAGGNAAKTAVKVLAALAKKNISYNTQTTEYPGHAISIARELLNTTLIPWPEAQRETAFPLLVVLGGDGTLHEVTNALAAQPQIPIAYIPCGSGNDFARGVGLNRNPLIALDHLLTLEQPQAYNLIHYVEGIQAEEGLASNNVGIGLDAAIVTQTNNTASKEKLNKFNLGGFSYLLTAFNVLFKQKGFPIMVEVNGETIGFDNAYLCTTTNHPFFGGGLAIAPDADIKQKELELIVVERLSLVKIFHLVIQLLNKSHLKSKNLHHFKSHKIRIVSTTAQFGQADGEEMGQRPFDIQFTTTQRLFWL